MSEIPCPHRAARPRHGRRPPSPSCSRERADAVEAATGRRPEIAGVADPQRGRLRRDPRALRPDRRADRRDRPGPRATCSTRCGPASRSSPPTSSCSPSTARSSSAVAREAGVQLRFEAAVAGVIPIVRAIQESFGATEIDEGLRHRQRHDQLHPHRDGGDRRRLRGGPRAGARSSATPRPTRATTSTAPTPRRRWRSSPGSPSTPRSRSTEVAYEGIETITARRPRLRQGARPLAEAARRRRAARRRDQRPRLPLLPLRRPPAGAGRRPVQRGHGRGAGDHRGDDVRARRRRHPDRLGGARRRRLDPLRRGAGARGRAPSCRSSPTSPPPSTCTSRSPTEPGVLARIAQVLGDNEISVKSVVQRGIGDDARLVMVVHECLESRFAAAVEEIGGSTTCARRRARSA